MPCSYFYEALENFDAVSHTRAVDCLKYMLLCKIMMNSPDEVRVPSASLSLDQHTLVHALVCPQNACARSQ